jgi:hypothetical protein
MNGLPATLTRPPSVLAAASSIAPDAAAAPTPELTTVSVTLDAGVPARLPLSGTRVVVLSVGVGRARALLDADPATVAVAVGSGAPPIDPTLLRDPDVPAPRLTLLDGSTLGESVPLVVGVTTTLVVGGLAAVELILDSAVITAGSLRSPGKFGSSIAFRWRDLHPATNAPPPVPTGDSTIPRLRPTALLRRFVVRAI